MISGFVTDVWVWLCEKVDYHWIVTFMSLESSFFPFPSEVVVPPGGAAAHDGRLDLALVILCGIAGSLIGAFFNYGVAVWLGRPFCLRYGKYFLLPPRKFEKAEAFFARHGDIATFVGRLLPGIRQVISFPAGLARMPLSRFAFFTALGSGIWVTVLAFIGYWVGRDRERVETLAKQVLLIMLPALVLLVVAYAIWYRRRRRAKAPAPAPEAES